MLLPFLLLFLLIIPHHPFFIEYKTISYFVSSNSTLYGLIIENITNIYSNDTVKFEFYLINLNYSEYIGPMIEFNNLSSPTILYYFPQVGSNIVQRGSLVFQLVGDKNGCYIYENVQHPVSTVSVVTYYYVNDSGIPSKIVFLQYGLNGLVSNNTYILYSSNLINSNEKIYFPSGLQKVSRAFSLNAFEHEVENIVFSVILLGIPVLLLFSKKKYYNNS
ncbi:hypothetical protein EWF20_01620 [Sulfolobus sp. S-194]|uniref:hypothetical protein n=1 Tax=Sulfolobus sp. S-194 TaxID=2512240 RepID=UPI001436FB28|nr:hypothetical protein [Sulfolobus sp. S-194]QIW22985.1 hypothetical protein EWF20_01620 [Sulfolobus sp. S-194]